MENIKIFLQQYPKVGFAIMILCVFLVTAIIKLPIKHFTNKIKNEKSRKAVNTIFFFIAVGVGIGIEYLYAYLTKQAFHIELGLIFGSLGVTTHNLYEVIKKVIIYLVDRIRHGKEIKVEEVLTIIDETTQKDNNSKKVVDNTKEVNKAIEDFQESLK